MKKGVKVKWSRYRPGVAQTVGRGIVLLFHDSGTRRGWVVCSTPRPHFTPGKDPVPIWQEAGWAPGPVWMSAENLSSTGIRSWTVQPIVSRKKGVRNGITWCSQLVEVVTGDAVVQLIIRAIDHTMDVLWQNHGKGSYINLGTNWMWSSSHFCFSSSKSAPVYTV